MKYFWRFILKGIIEMGNWEEKTIRVKLESFERIQMGGEVLVLHANAKNTTYNSDYEATLRVLTNSRIFATVQH